MKKIFLFVVLICLISVKNVSAQQAKTPKNTFEITSKVNSPEAVVVAKSIESADLDNYRLRDSRRKLTFENGVVVELLSANELKNLGYKVDPSFYRESLDKNYVEPTYSISDTGMLIQNHHPSFKNKGYNN